LSDDAIVEHRRIEIAHIIDDDFSFCGICQGLNAIREIRGAEKSCVEGERGTRRNVMDNFQHRSAFVRAAGGTVFQDINEGRQVTGFLGIWNATGELADRIGKNANSYILPCKAGGITIRIGKNDLIANKSLLRFAYT
jgi:hypothetical protein